LAGRNPTESPKRERATLRVVAEALWRLPDGKHMVLRRRILDLLSERRFGYLYVVTSECYREVVLRWFRELVREGPGGLGYSVEDGGGGAWARVRTTAGTSRRWPTCRCRDASP
jgi:hypothetical protein